MDNLKTFENFEQEGDDFIETFITGLNISDELKQELREFIDELLEEDDLDEQMDMVDSFYFDCDDDDICDEVDSFLRDLV
jgi:hypothetical protein